MLKGHTFINECVPLDLQDDATIVALRDEANKLIDTIKRWQYVGREYIGSGEDEPFERFEKFVLAKQIILGAYKTGSILDIGCYSGIFIKHMATMGFECVGTDIHKELMARLDKEAGGNPMYCFSGDFITLRQFDIVTAFDVIEHCFDTHAMIDLMESAGKHGALIMINLPQMTPGYKDEVFEHLKMFSHADILKLWGGKKEFMFRTCTDELGRPTSFITYRNE